ncbi:hypothetical protein ACHQM5_018491 [Ranunculus cassubicifolius]
MKSEDKKQIRWDTSMDNILLDTLGDAVREGKKYGRKWDTSVMKKLLELLSAYTKEQVRSMHIDNRSRQMRTEYLNFKELRKKSGSTFDLVNDAIVLSNDVWNSILANPKEKKKWGAFKERGPKWDYEKLSIVMGNYHATGSYSPNGLDDIETINVEEHTDDLPSTKEKVDLEEGEETASCASTKNINPSQSKRQHGKRSKAFDEMKDMLGCVNSNLEKLRESVDPLHYGKLLRKAVEEVTGFSEKYLNAAFKILMKDRVDGEIFILTKGGRKDILTEMSNQIGDL